MAAIYVGKCASNLEKAINRLPDTKKDKLFYLCHMNEREISKFRGEIITLGDLRHLFAHLGQNEAVEEKIQKFNPELLRNGMVDLEKSAVQEIQIKLEKINVDSRCNVFGEL